jgi:hypothetical protein
MPQVHPAHQLQEAVKEPNMRLSMALTRFLSFTNGLEAFTAIAAIAWATGLIAGVLSGKVHPSYIPILGAPLLALIGVMSLIALAMGWRRVRTAGSLLAFQVWAMVTVLTWTEQPIGAGAVGLYAGMAVAELALYVRTKLQLDVRALQAGCVIHANINAATRCGAAIRGRDDA